MVPTVTCITSCRLLGELQGQEEGDQAPGVRWRDLDWVLKEGYHGVTCKK